MRRLTADYSSESARATAESRPPQAGQPAGDPDRGKAHGSYGTGEWATHIVAGLLRHSTDYILLLAPDHRILEAGARFTDTFLAGEAPNGRDFLGLVDTGSRRKARVFLDAPTTDSCTIELDLRVGPKTIRLVNFTFSPIPGSPLIIAAIGRDQEEPLALVQQVVELNRQLEAARRELELQALTDPLTSLGNRRWLFERLDALWASAERSGQSVWLVMADLDEFKKINDAFGHQAGDEALRVAALTLRGALRAGDLVGRYGGEEFVAAGISRDPADLSEMTQRLLEAIRGVRVELPDRTLQLTVSLGAVLALPHRSCPPWVALQAADRAVYRAKAAGRDRCEIDSGPVGATTRATAGPPLGARYSARAS